MSNTNYTLPESYPVAGEYIDYSHDISEGKRRHLPLHGGDMRDDEDERETEFISGWTIVAFVIAMAVLGRLL